MKHTVNNLNPIKHWTGIKSTLFNIISLPVNISCKKGLTAKQAEYVYSKCKNDEVIGSKQVFEYENDDVPNIDFQLNPYECAIPNDFELCNVHVDYVKSNGKELPLELNLTQLKENVKKGYR